MTATTYTPGAFVWREVMTPDLDKAKGFYGELFGWKFNEMDMGDFEYPMIMVADRAVGGVVKLDASSGHPPHWMSYVSVEDVDVAARAAKAHGGGVPVGPMEIPNVGQMAVIADPDHAHVTVFHAAQGDPPAGVVPGVGTFCWETLSTTDVARATDFYGAVVGWSVGPGPGGPDVPVFMAREQAVADLQIAENMPPSWSTYVVVEDLAGSQAKLEKLGGRTLIDRMDIPNVGSIGFFTDPFGAALGLFEPPATS